MSDKILPVASILAMLPLTAPLAAWIVYSASGGDHQQTAAVLVAAFTVFGTLVALPYFARLL